MIHWPHTPKVLRVVAIVIAVAGLVDPVITTSRLPKPTVAVIAIDPEQDSLLAKRVATTLNGTFEVIPAIFTGADATILVGNRPPTFHESVSSPVFAITRLGTGPALSINSLSTPTSAQLESRVPVAVVVAARGAKGQQVEVTLRADGVAVDRAVHDVSSAEQMFTVPLSFAPDRTGAVPLRVTAAFHRGGSTTDNPVIADALVSVRAQRWEVLCYDPRPSWASTFVRRAIEEDSRFLVTSRVVTSHNISTDAGAPPTDLDNLAAMRRFDLVVVGAPAALTDREVNGLEAFMRRRGGRILLLMDDHAAGPWQRLVGVSSWVDYNSKELPVHSVQADSADLVAAAMTWPTHLPPGSEPIAFALTVPGNSITRAPVIWRAAVGPGELIVSGALDSWRFRDSTLSGFNHFWRGLAAKAAAAAAPDLQVTMSAGVLAPHDQTEVSVLLREPALEWEEKHRDVTASIAAVVEPASGPIGASIERMPVRFWPDGNVGEFRGTVSAPGTPGEYQLSVLAGGAQLSVPFDVKSDARHPIQENVGLLSLWVQTRGGKLFGAGELGALPAAVLSAVHPESRPESWHPMRSLWWFVIFALALSGEWWLRRRQGGA